jgi:hypothetical protein
MVFFDNMSGITATIKTGSIFEIANFQSQEFLSLLENESEKANVSKISVLISDYTAKFSEIGSAVDAFLTPRPWWYVDVEPFDWNYHSNHAKLLVLKRFRSDVEIIYRRFASNQFPLLCSEKMMRFDFRDKIDSLGRYFYDLGYSFSSFPDHAITVLVPFVVDSSASDGIIYLDQDACPHQRNKFQCIFLCPTNCSIPSEVINSAVNNQKPPHFIYSAASVHGTPIPHDKYHALIVGKSANHDMHTYPELNVTQYTASKDSERGYFVQNKAKNTRHELFTYGLFYRLNYEFRSYVSEYFYAFQASQKKKFPVNGDCVAIHIRRGERIREDGLVREGQDARDWCRTHQRLANGSCWNEVTNEVILDNSYCSEFETNGCHSATPYAAITTADYLRAARIINNRTNNIVIITDASDAVQSDLDDIHDERNTSVFLVPTPHSHRAKSTANGVAFLAAIEIVSQCSSFLGHSASAVTMFMLRVTCAKRFGIPGYERCPNFYDFGNIERRMRRQR